MFHQFSMNHVTNCNYNEEYNWQWANITDEKLSISYNFNLNYWQCFIVTSFVTLFTVLLIVYLPPGGTKYLLKILDTHKYVSYTKCIMNENQIYTRVDLPTNNIIFPLLGYYSHITRSSSANCKCKDSFALGNLSGSRNYFMIVELHICGSNELLGSRLCTLNSDDAS